MWADAETHPYFAVLDNNDLIKKLDMWRWCCEKWGRPRYEKPINWSTSNDLHYMFKFDNELDRALFLLRWG